MIDYHKILTAYIERVGRMEGVDFVGGGLAGLTAEENIALLECSRRSSNEQHNKRIDEYIEALKK